MEHMFCILPHSQGDCLMKIKNVKWQLQILLMFFFQQEYNHHRQYLVKTNNIHKALLQPLFSSIFTFFTNFDFLFHFLNVSPNLSLKSVMGNPPDHLPLSVLDLETLWLMNKLGKTPGQFSLGQRIRMGFRISVYLWLTTYISRKSKDNIFYCAESFKNNHKETFICCSHNKE